jgi:hypothetical protein
MLHGLKSIWDVVEAAMLPMAVLVLTVSTLFVMSGWNRRRELLARQGQPHRPDRFELGQTPFAAGVLGVAAEARAVLRRFDALAAQQLVELELAVQPDLTVRADPRAFREMLGDLVGSAIEQAPCGRVLLGAARLGGRVDISVTDDGDRPDRGLRLSKLRTTERLAALHGATLEVKAIPGHGTTVHLRLPVGDGGRRTAYPDQAIDAAKVWTAPQHVHGAARHEFTIQP